LKHFRLYYPKVSGIFWDCIIWISSECWMVTCLRRVIHGTDFSKGFIGFNGWLDSLNTFFDPHLWIVTLYATHSSQISTINTFKPSQLLISSSHTLSSSFLLQQCVFIVGFSYKKTTLEFQGLYEGSMVMLPHCKEAPSVWVWGLSAWV